MDSVFGDCWRCQRPARNIKCDNCLIAEYCREECRHKDRFIHKSFCRPAIDIRTCSFCKCRSNDVKTCSACYSSFYCNSTCQKNHWANHKTDCKTHQNNIILQSHYILIYPYTELPWYLGTAMAEDYLNLNKNEGSSYTSPLKLLFVGVGDIKDAVRTVTDIPQEFIGKIEFVLNDFSPHTMARNILFLYGALVRQEFGHLVQIWYSYLLTPACLTFLKSTLKRMINSKREVINSMKDIIEISDSHWESCKDIWEGWLKVSNNPEACQKVIDLRQKKLECDEGSEDGLQRYYDCVPEFHKKSLQIFWEKGLFLPLNSSERRKAVHGNPTLTCFNPMKDEYQEKYPDLQTCIIPQTWKKEIRKEDDMILTLRSTTVVFRCWDYLEVKKQAGLKSDIIEMYVLYLEKIFKKFSTYVKDRNVHFRLIVDDFRKLDQYLFSNEKFDRIATSNLCDYFVTPSLLEHFAKRLNTINEHSVLICRQENWPNYASQYTDLSSNTDDLLVATVDMKERQEILGGLPDAKRFFCLTFNTTSEDYKDFKPFLYSKLLSEILLYRHESENLPLDKTSFQHPDKMAKKFGMKFRDFRLELNHVIPFHREGNIRKVSCFQMNNCRYIEWYPIPK